MASVKHVRGLRAWLCVGLAVIAALARPAAAAPLTVDQGAAWTQAARDDFYTRDQGSRLIPYAWMRALRLPSLTPFLADGLARYGYLANDRNPTPGLPVGFLVAPDPVYGPTIGMTCAACHTRQIEVSGQPYRIDGGPALVDFQAFLADLNAAIGDALASPAAFATFAATALNTTPTAAQIATLRRNVETWYAPFRLIVTKSLPTISPWGIGRLDAISMIFNRVTGLDIGPAETGGIIADNIVVADAPARYPFLWNASMQDLTQWPGFAPNGSALNGLGRNTGEVLGVFAKFRPTKDTLGVVHYGGGSSIDLPGLWQLEKLITKIGPPAYPGPIDAALAERGRAIFGRSPAQNGCAECHMIQPGGLRPPALVTWKTLSQDVGTDSREWQVLARTVDPGVLAGALVPLTVRRLPRSDAPAGAVLKTAAFGAIIAQLPTLLTGKADLSMLTPGQPPGQPRASPSLLDLKSWLADPLDLPKAPPPGSFPYESRVLQGIWAAAPYLHNGSVPTLDDLLKPAAQRPASFAVGIAYDLARIGLAPMQAPGFSFTYVTTGCEARNSGNSRCGHEFGTTLLPDEKAALLEYLKRL